MTISGEPFKLRDHQKDCFKISLSGELQGNDSVTLRQEVERYSISDYDVIYLDTREVTGLDLSFVNEIIHSDATLKNTGKSLVFLYRQGSTIEKWIETTGLDKFVTTAMVPAEG
ncbi:hypothetical protein [Persicitalea jodogahamensis]|uniref:STAS domain-containing protein n=1 Tax=Persicitalea jodogahamensis TaxID=402147 RepID=A0A8J3DD84_9BACT|nr:hypothetical protein [Persicitalea jodogahamensis]GHB79651.1 hypothetical protein GCM10007390_37190 [Persicitalea jodogahamensis]